MTPKVIQRIINDNPSCVMLKHEDWPGLEKISALRSFESEGALRPISILTGNGGLFLDFELERGADGAMTGYAFPDMLVDVVKLTQSGQARRCPTTSSMRISRSSATSSSRESVSPSASTSCRSAAPSPTMRNGPRVHRSQQRERLRSTIYWGRLARHDPRAKTPART